MPHFERETTYVSLRDPDHYAFYDGDIVSSTGDTVAVDRYRDVIEETVVAHSTAKHARWNGSRYMVGALARVNNNFEQLLPPAQTAAKELGLAVPAFNPFMNTHAQLVECVHCVEECLHIVDELLARGIHAEEELAPPGPRAGQAVGVVEAPRGLLLHDYAYDEDGKCTSANLVIPTAQNLANLEADMKGFVPTIIDRDAEQIRHQLEMLARAYDPCISCSTHVVYR
jgi:coenzyme F420-reducing hydrogenase alpha subunit